MSGAARITLAIESAVCGGSISLIRDGREIANWIGSDSVSKAEDLLPNIETLLNTNNVSRNEIGLIAVSAGPGSFTGIRIGIATALGFGRALNIELTSVSVLKAMVFACPADQDLIAAVPVGRNAVCLQSFQKQGGEITELDEPRTLREDSFFDFLRAEAEKHLVLHASLCKMIDASPTITNFGENLAYAIGVLCLNQPTAGQTKPLFISKSF